MLNLHARKLIDLNETSARIDWQIEKILKVNALKKKKLNHPADNSAKYVCILNAREMQQT